MICLKIGVNDSGQILKKFVKKTFPKFPNSAIYKAIRTKKIKINGKRCQANLILNLGDVFELFGFDEFVQETKQTRTLKILINKSLKVVYEDENLIVVDKPLGLCSHPCNFSEDSLISRILNYLITKKQIVLKGENSFLPSICNRLDVNTSGLVVAAKNAKALRCFNELLKSRKIVKIYSCLAEGVFEKREDVLTGWLIKNCKKNISIVSEFKRPNAKRAILKYFVVKQFLDYAKLNINLYTGRFHQIRAQLSFIGHPLVGDFKYGAAMNEKIKLRAVGLLFNTQDSMFDYLNGKEIKIESNF